MSSMRVISVVNSVDVVGGSHHPWVSGLLYVGDGCHGCRDCCECHGIHGFMGLMCVMDVMSGVSIVSVVNVQGFHRNVKLAFLVFIPACSHSKNARNVRM